MILEKAAIGNGLRIEIKDSKGLIIDESGPSRYYHGLESCGTTMTEFEVKNGKIEKGKSYVNIQKQYKESCEFCKDRDECSIKSVLQKASELLQKGQPRTGYLLLKTYYAHRLENEANFSGWKGLGPWFASDLLLLAAKSGESCSDEIRLLGSVQEWTPTSRKAVDFNKGFCRKNSKSR